MSFVSPQILADALGVAVEKIHTWIRAGELEAINISTTTTGRPRWKVSQEAIDQFLERRRQQKPEKRTRRKRHRDTVAFY